MVESNEDMHKQSSSKKVASSKTESQIATKLDAKNDFRPQSKKITGVECLVILARAQKYLIQFWIVQKIHTDQWVTLEDPPNLVYPIAKQRSMQLAEADHTAAQTQTGRKKD